jgi:predicted dehydrogenase
MWARVHAAALARDPRARLTWVASRTRASADALQADFAVPNATNRLHDLLAAPDVDAVIVSTPPATHADIAVQVLQAGKHLLLEKPLATTLDDADRLVAEAAARPDLVALEASCRSSRLQPKFHFIRDLIDSGRLGTVYHFHYHELKLATYVEYNPRAASWAADRSQAGGGTLFDWGEYDLSFHLGVLGDVHRLVDVHAWKQAGLRSPRAAGRVADVEQHAAALLRFDPPLTCYYERGGGAHGELPPLSRIYGTRAGIHFQYLPWGSDEIQLFEEGPDGDQVRETLTVDMTRTHDDENAATLAHFLDCILDAAPPAMTLPLARKHLEIILRILQ